jgi:hypothetical protein
VAKPDEIAVGPTEALSLRVSAAALARVVFTHPENDLRMLALEHKATVALAPNAPQVTVRAQPFGGAVRILDTDRFSTFVGDFTFDSKRSRSERDFRVFVRPSSLGAVHEFCLHGAGQSTQTDLSRELREEFEDALEFEIRPEMYTMRPAGVVLEDRPTPTRNVRAPGRLTARIYWVYEVEILDPAVSRRLLLNSQVHSAHDLGRAALEAHARGEPGWASAILVLQLDRVRDAYLTLPPQDRGIPVSFQGTTLAGNLPAVLDGVPVPKYERRPSGHSEAWRPDLSG